METKPKTHDKAPRPRGTGSLYLRGNVWWISYSRHGKKYQESTGFTGKRKAEDKLRDRLAELQTGTFVGLKTERIKVSELAKDALRDYRINNKRSIDDVTARWVLHLEPFYGHLQAVDVTSTLLTSTLTGVRKRARPMPRSTESLPFSNDPSGLLCGALRQKLNLFPTSPC